MRALMLKIIHLQNNNLLYKQNSGGQFAFSAIYLLKTKIYVNRTMEITF